jgi:hypothetical protein
MTFDMKDYIDVKTRVEMLYKQHPDARIVTSPPQLMPGRGDMIYVITSIFRTADDLSPTTGMAAELVEGKTSFTRNSELMNCETSAIGRAIANMGIGITKGMASLNEVVRQEENNKATTKSVHGGGVGGWSSPSMEYAPELDAWGQPMVLEAVQHELNANAQQCKHGAMQWKEGIGKTGKPYSGWVCTTPKDEGQCPARWN